jgi:alpha-beta hydrolase superfamily lysophospholipase
MSTHHFLSKITMLSPSVFWRERIIHLGCNRRLVGLSIFIVWICVGKLTGQNILQDYYQGNIDSMTKDAIQLIRMPDPVFKTLPPVSPGPRALTDAGFEQVHQTQNRFFTTRDQDSIFAYHFPKSSPNTILLLHGIKSSGYSYKRCASLLQEASQAEVYALDIRGHGRSGGVDGDVDYINQYADDLADIIKTIRKEKPDRKIIVAGHSMGGGIALRYAMNTYPETADGFILLAPLIGHNSPAFPAAEASPDSIEPFIKIHFGRIIGLKMLNEIGRTELNDLPVLFFNLPENMPSRKYTYRANMSMAPEDYQAGLQAVNAPMLVLIGSADEAFNATALQKAVLENSRAEMHIIEKSTHNSIVHHPETFKWVQKWFQQW